MSNPRIEVDVVANVAGVASGVSAATSQLDKLGRSAEVTGPKIGKLTDATRNYNAVGVNFARLIQDAPFGIIGVGNNITALAESFDQARNKGQSFTQILGGIFSAGNLVTLGVSALVTAYTLYTQYSEKTVDVNKKLDETYKDLADTIDETATKLSTLKFVNDIIIKQQDEVRKLDKNFSVFSVTAEEAVKITTDAFSKLNQTQLTGIKSTLSELANDNLKVVGNALNLTRTEVVKFIEGLKGNTTAFEALDPKVRDAVSAYNNLNKQIKVAGEQLDFYKEKQDKVDFRKEALDAYSKSWDDYNLKQETANNLTEKLNVITKDYEKNIRSVLTAIPKKPIRIESDEESLQAFNDELFKTQMAAYNAQLELMKTSDAAFEFSDNLSKIENREIKINTNVGGLKQEVADVLPFLEQLETALNPKKFTDFEQRVSDFAFTVRDLLQNNLADAFIDLGYTIGEALATGGNVIQAVGQSVLKSFGRFLGQFGEQLIAYGVATIAFGKASIGLSNPFTAIPSGGLAIAAGVALTAISGIIGSLGRKGPGGGGGGGSSVGSSGAGGGSQFTGLGAQGGMFATQRDLNGELVVRGQDLVYVFGQASNRINKG